MPWPRTTSSPPVVQALNMDPVTPVSPMALTLLRVHRQRHRQPDQPGGDDARQLDDEQVRRRLWEYDLLKELKFRSSVNLDLSLGSQKIFFPTFDLNVGPNDPNRPAYEWREVNGLIRNENKWMTWQWENTLPMTRT